MKKKFICTVCGYIYEGEEVLPSALCVVHRRQSFKSLTEDTTPEFAAEHKLGIAFDADVPKELLRHCRETLLVNAEK